MTAKKQADVQSVRKNIARRDFLKTAGGVALAAGGGALLPTGRIWATPKNATAIATKSPESLVKVLYESLSPAQKETLCFAWDHQVEGHGLLRSFVSANWNVTDETIDSEYFSKDQQHLVRKIFEGIIHPDWHERIDQQLDDDAGGFGVENSIAIFGQPGSEKFEFVLTGRHMTLRCDGNSAEHMAFGGPIFYGHAADGFDEGPDHKGNVFWPQALAANDLYTMLDGKQQEAALVQKGRPAESKIAFAGQEGDFQGLAVSDMSPDQREHLQGVLQKLIEPYRQDDRDEVVQCLKAQGGIDACHLAFYAEGDIGSDKVWDCWRLEGPAFVWNWRGAPHVHVWVNVASDPGVKTYT